MKLGICIPNHWGVEDVRSIFSLATMAEEMGFDSIWVSEHVFNAGPVHQRLGGRPYYDPLAILSYVAAITTRIGLGTSVLVLPYHNPIRLAKTAATLDVMSGGRLILGVGVGALEQELNALGARLAERGAIVDEAIAIMKELWTQEDPTYQGRYHSFSGMKFSPKPIQKPHIPLLVGGNSPGAIRRAARHGNGWHPTALPPAELTRKIEYLREQAEATGRDLSEVPVSIRLDMDIPRGTRGEPAGQSRSSVAAKNILHSAQAFKTLGVDRIVVSPNTGDTNAIESAMEMLAHHVIPAFA